MPPEAWADAQRIARINQQGACGFVAALEIVEHRKSVLHSVSSCVSSASQALAAQRCASLPLPHRGTKESIDVLLKRFAEGVNLSFNHDVYNGHVYRLGPKFAQFFSNGRKMPQWMVPHAVTQRTSDSHRTLGDFEQSDYQVTEFDSGSRQEQASKILWLKDQSIAPALVMVVWSAGKVCKFGGTFARSQMNGE
jgi:hypothetical protein